MDWMYLGVTSAFFVLSWGLVRLCLALQSPGSGRSGESAKGGAK